MTHQDPLNILFFDCETTGLSPEKDYILEVCAIPAILSEGILIIFEDKAVNKVINAPAEHLSRMDKYVQDMHTKNGLLQEVTQSGSNLMDVEDEILKMVKEVYGNTFKNQVQLAGTSVSFDRTFIKHKMRRLDSQLSYRILDVNLVRSLMLNKYSEITEAKVKEILSYVKTHSNRSYNSLLAEMFNHPEKYINSSSEHRAYADIKHSIFWFYMQLGSM